MTDPPPPPSRRPLVYVLHSSKLYGTERMTLATLGPLRDEFDGVLFGPPGPAMDVAEGMGLEVHRFRGARAFARGLRPVLRRHRSLTFASTGVVQSAVLMAVNLLYRRRVRHVHMVHGGVEERVSYGRKKYLNLAGVTFVTVSRYARERMIANGVRADRIEVVHNFLTDARVATAPQRPAYDAPGYRRVLVVSRLDPIKRVGLLLDALDRIPGGLADVAFTVLGMGPEVAALKERAGRDHPNVTFAGFCDDVPGAMAGADLLLHTCPVEPFGLVVLEAMAAGLVPLVPDQGGPAEVVTDGVDGFRYRAGDADHLAARLVELRQVDAATLNRAAHAARRTVRETFAAGPAVERYRQLFRPA